MGSDYIHNSEVLHAGQRLNPWLQIAKHSQRAPPTGRRSPCGATHLALPKLAHHLVSHIRSNTCRRREAGSAMPAVSGSAPPRAARAPRGHTTHGTVARCAATAAVPALLPARKPRRCACWQPLSLLTGPLSLLITRRACCQPLSLLIGPPKCAPRCPPMPGASARGRLPKKPMTKVEIREDAAVAVIRLALSWLCGGGGSAPATGQGNHARWRHAAGGDWTALHWTGAAGLPQRGAGAAFLQLRNPAGAPNSPSVTGSESGQARAPTSAAARLLIPTHPLPPGTPAPASQSQNPPPRPHSTRTHS